MSGQANLTYSFEGSFEGLLCCGFESYEQKEIPKDIITSEQAQTRLFPAKEKACRVLNSIPQKIGAAALEFVQQAFLICLLEKNLYILLFLRLGYSHGAAVMTMLSDEVVHKLFKAVKSL